MSPNASRPQMKGTVTMRSAHVVAVAGCAFLFASCAGRAPGPVSGTATPLVVPHGSGEIALTGSVNFSRKIAVKGCWVSPPGSSVLSGYSMTIAGDGPVLSGGVLLRGYSHDGSYVIDANDMPATLALYLNGEARLPGGVVLTNGKGSSLSISIADGGRSGKADFKDWNGGRTHPAPISGAISWTCALVRHA